MTILIENALLVVTLDDKKTRISDGAVLIEGNQIKAVGKTEEIKKQLTTPDFGGASTKAGRTKGIVTTSIDATNCIVLPGFINTHHHLYQILNRVIPEVQNAKLFDWIKFLYELWRNITPE
ncbi:MAG: hypothetical protein QME68_08125 [Elusimicrobiota bacterium]|nr:hypothetical protein [Elusimicrobiota bacterium]